MTDPHQPISFAAVCREEADFLQSEAGGCNSPDCYGHSSMRERAAILRELATLCERAEKFGQPLNPDLDILSSGEHANFEEWDAIVRTIALGYRPPGQEGT